MRRLSSNWDSGTNSARFRLPVQFVRALCDLTQGRLQDLIEQPGHRYFHGFEQHSSQREEMLGLGFERVSISAIRDELEDRESLRVGDF